jgi:hypothetical protein
VLRGKTQASWEGVRGALVPETHTSWGMTASPNQRRKMKRFIRNSQRRKMK